MGKFKFLLFGVVFGIVMIKSEAASWFRIYEMFNFQSFHMYGIIGVAVIVGLISVQLIKKFNIDIGGEFLIHFFSDKINRFVKIFSRDANNHVVASIMAQ